MTMGEFLFLDLVVLALAVFGITLGIQSRKQAKHD